MQTDLDQSQIWVRVRNWKRSQLGSAESITWTQTLGTTNPPNLKLSWRRKALCIRQRRGNKKSTDHFCTQIANNTTQHFSESSFNIFEWTSQGTQKHFCSLLQRKKSTGLFLWIYKKKNEFNNTKVFFFFVCLVQQMLYTLNGVNKIKTWFEGQICPQFWKKLRYTIWMNEVCLEK